MTVKITILLTILVKNSIILCLFFLLEYLVDSREGLGMLDLDSPLWASDHFGLVTTYLIT